MDTKMLKDMLNELKGYKRDKNVLMEGYINDRLNKSLKSYYSEVSDSLTYLQTKSSANVMRKANK